MRQVFLLFLTCFTILHSENYRSAVANPGGTMQKSLPGGSPFNDVPELRIEFRVSHFSTAVGIGGVGAMYFAVISPSQLRVTNWFDGGESMFLNLPAGTNDVLIRVQRSVSNRKWSVQCWTADGSQRLLSGFGDAVPTKTINLASADPVTVGGVGTQWAWLRVFNTSVPMDAPAPSNLAPAKSILNYEFEGNGNDSSGSRQNLSGGAAYVRTSVTPLLGEARTVRAGRPFPMDCTDTDASSYAWQQISGPSTLSFSDPNAGQTTVSGADQFGEYEIQCRATGAGSNATGTTVIKIGAVQTADDGVVIPPTRTLDMLLGPMLRANVTEWSWYDRMRRDTGEYWATATRNFSADISSIEGENYYDSGLVQYQNYYRTGMTRHLTLARAIADRFYLQFFKQQERQGSCASNFIAPRDAAIVGLLIRATEQGDTAAWTCLTNYVSFALNLWVETRGADKGYRIPYYGTREGGYALIFATALAESHPDEAVRSSMKARIAKTLTNYYRAHQCLAGDQRRECLANYTMGTGTITAVKGSATITGSGTAFSSLLRPGNRLAFKNTATGANYDLVISQVDSDSRLTLADSYDGTTYTTGAAEWARDTQDGLRPGGYRFDDPSTGGGVLGWFDQVWHSALLIEGVARAYRQGIDPATAKSIIVDYGTYLLREPRTYLTGACTFAPGPRIKAHSYLTYSITGDWTSTESCSSPNALKDLRATNNTVVLVYGQAYRLTGNPEFRKRGDEAFSASFGFDSGAGHDFYAGLADSTYNNGKQYGQSFRSSGWYLADRLGPELPKVNAVVNGASFLAEPVAVAPGEVIRLYGQSIGPEEAVVSDPPSTEVGETRVLFDGVPAQLLFVRADQISAVVPYSVSGVVSTLLEIEYKKAKSEAILIPVQATHPGVFTADQSGTGGVAMSNEDGTINSPDNPAKKGSIIAFFATGEGQTNPAGADGKLAADPLPQPVQPLIVGIANGGAEVLYGGGVPGLVAGLMQIVARVPMDAPSGPAVPLIIKIGDNFSQPGVTMAVQ